MWTDGLMHAQQASKEALLLPAQARFRHRSDAPTFQSKKGALRLPRLRNAEASEEACDASAWDQRQVAQQRWRGSCASHAWAVWMPGERGNAPQRPPEVEGRTSRARRPKDKGVGRLMSTLSDLPAFLLASAALQCRRPGPSGSAGRGLVIKTDDDTRRA